MSDSQKLQAIPAVVWWIVLVSTVRADLVTGGIVYLWDVGLIVAIVLSVRAVRAWRAAR